MPIVIRICRTPTMGLITLLLCAVKNSAYLKLNVFSLSMCPCGSTALGLCTQVSSGELIRQLLWAEWTFCRKVLVLRICRQFCWRGAALVHSITDTRWKVTVSHFQRVLCWAGFLPMGSVMCKWHQFPQISAPSQVSIKSVFADEAFSRKEQLQHMLVTER